MFGITTVDPAGWANTIATLNCALMPSAISGPVQCTSVGVTVEDHPLGFDATTLLAPAGSCARNPIVGAPLQP
jgi:hypothetical protein